VLRLMLTYGLRKGEIRECQFKHFDHVRRTLTVFGKGGKVSAAPDPRAGVLARPRAADPRHRGQGLRTS
jgi:site-specific recombinase XerC